MCVHDQHVCVHEGATRVCTGGSCAYHVRLHLVSMYLLTEYYSLYNYVKYLMLSTCNSQIHVHVQYTCIKLCNVLNVGSHKVF